MLVFIMTFKNTFHAFTLQFPVHSAPFKLQTVLTEELELTSHNKSSSSTSSITTCQVLMSMLKTQCCTYSVLSCFCHPSTRANTMLLPTRHLLATVWRSPFIKTTLSVCSYSQLSITTTFLTSRWNIQYAITQNSLSSSPPP